MIPDRREPFAGSGKNPGGEKGAAPDLWVRFFGGFEVSCRGEPLELGRNSKAVAIFKCLLARKGRPVSQETLMGWLWPESSPKKARWSLNSAVYALRRSLDEHSPDIASSDCVILGRGHYHLARGLRISSDVEEFDAGYERGRFLERARKTEDAVSEYEEAVALYRGDYLVEDLYEDWTMIERERLTSAYVDLLDRLAAYYARTGNLQRCITDRYRLLEKDPYHEESYRSLMRCYARLGLRGRALRQYELCERRLRSLHDIPAAPETRELHEKLLDGEEI
ncbi:MAG: BTAD domain-containing putative transcriptional regulator [Rubrobacteraceae bacterium]